MQLGLGHRHPDTGRVLYSGTPPMAAILRQKAEEDGESRKTPGFTRNLLASKLVILAVSLSIFMSHQAIYFVFNP